MTEKPLPTNLFIFGFGYTAEYLARKLQALGISITATSRTPERRKEAIEMGVHGIDFTEAAVKEGLQFATHILISTQPTKDFGDPVLGSFKKIIEHFAPQITWIGYLSSTGVYGDHHGNWVDETSAHLSLGTQSRLRLKAEEDWITFARLYSHPLHIFRLAGIYGPKRNALGRIIHGQTQTIVKEGHCFSRIHVADIAHVLMTSMQQPQPFSIFNVADDEPAPTYDVDEYAATLLGIPPPKRVPFETATLSDMAYEFYTHHRRVSNAKIKQELHISLSFPTYREGLTHLYQTGEY